jgi:dihydroorotate dehydrogenase (NAD+) catalytic subunit
VGGEPVAAAAPDGAGHAQRRRPPGPGHPHWLDHVLPDLLRTGATVVASIWGRTVDDYARAADLLASAPSQVVAVEVNLSCPNLEGREAIFAHDAELAAAAVGAAAAAGAAPRGPS